MSTEPHRTLGSCLPLIALAWLFGAAAGCGSGLARHPGAEQIDAGLGPADAGTRPHRVWRECRVESDCVIGELCIDGICTAHCAAAGDCLAHEFCDSSAFGDRLCHERAAAECPAQPCHASQICVGGLCSTPPSDMACTPRADGDDDCGPYALCSLTAARDANRCHTQPLCPESGICPVGQRGAVCNDGALPDKARLCLGGRCLADAHCPPDALCTFLSPADALGVCTRRRILCNSDPDCPAGQRCTPIPTADLAECR